MMCGTAHGDDGRVLDGQILVVGEALIDEVHRGNGHVSDHPGGSPANVALTLGRLGRDVELATWISDDRRGQVIRDWLTASHVTLGAGSDKADRTSVAVARLDTTGAATYTFDLSWQVPAGTCAGPRTVAVHTGSIGAVLEPGCRDVEAVLSAAKDTATITYDPNIRPAVMGAAADVVPRVMHLVSMADVVKVSDEDLSWVAPGTDPLDTARTWAGQGPAMVVVTRGGAGVVAVAPCGELEVPAHQVKVVDTVGAGDSFMGALLDGLWAHGLLGARRRAALQGIDRLTLRDILNHAASVAAITVSRAGANPPWRRELSGCQLPGQ